MEANLAFEGRIAAHAVVTNSPPKYQIEGLESEMNQFINMLEEDNTAKIELTDKHMIRDVHAVAR